MREAMYWKSLDNGRIECLLCPQDCKIPDGQAGRCRGRRNLEGKFIAENYGRVTSVGMDPIEKKPLYHFFPGRGILSAGTYGCNLRCRFCQNSDISQMAPPDIHYQDISPEEMVEMAIQKGSMGIAYTYNEPLIWYEYVLDTAILAREAGLANVLVTNGYVNPEPLENLLPHIDAMNIDIKSFSEEFYKDIASASLAPVLSTAKTAALAGVHVETTTLIVPGHNDSPDELDAIAEWIAGELGSDTPAHVSAYFPRYKFKAPATTLEGLLSAYHIFKKRLDYVYIGNIAAGDGSNTCCKKCGALLVERAGYLVNRANLKEKGICGECGAENHFTETVKPPAARSDK